MRATHAEVNRNLEEYGETDDEADIQRICDMLACLGTPKQVLQRTLDWKNYLSSFKVVQQPNYLGNPSVVRAILQSYFQVLTQIWWQKSINQDKYQEAHRISQIFSHQNADYTAVGQWNTVAALGSVLIECFELDADYCAGEELYFIVSEALASIGMHFNNYRKVLVHNRQRPPKICATAGGNASIAAVCGTGFFRYPWG